MAVILSALSVPILAREAARERDPRLFWTLLAAQELKLCGAVARHHVVYNVYRGTADAPGYHRAGARLARRFRTGNLRTDLESHTGTDFMRLATGVVYTVVGPSRLSGFLVFSWLGFWGLFFFHRAFALAVPEGRARGYSRLVFFLPSLIFWPSSIGKEAWMVFSLGIGALGTARVLTRPTASGFALAGLGTGMSAVVRPHVAAIHAAAMASAHVLQRPGDHRGRRSRSLRRLSRAATAAAALGILVWAQRFLRDRRILTDRGVTSMLEQVTERTAMGGSRFQPPIAQSYARAPLGAGTVLFRPHILEAHNAQAMAAALETSFLILLSLLRLRPALAAVGTARQRPYVAFALAYTGLFTVAHSAYANFGLLARQRVQLLPLYFVLLSVPLPGDEGAAGPLRA